MRHRRDAADHRRRADPDMGPTEVYRGARFGNVPADDGQVPPHRKLGKERHLVGDARKRRPDNLVVAPPSTTRATGRAEAVDLKPTLSLVGCDAA
jgi:hypothetical protein